MDTKIIIAQIIALLAIVQFSTANYRPKRSFPWPTFLGGGKTNDAQDPPQPITVPTVPIQPIPTHQRVHYPIWRIHKYHGVDLKPVPISLMRHNNPQQIAVSQPIVYQQQQTSADAVQSSESKIPYELLDLARTFGVTDISNLPSLDEAQNLLGASSRDETISIIKELAETANGRELIRNFLKQNEVVEDNDDADSEVPAEIGHEQYGVPIETNVGRQSWQQPNIVAQPNLPAEDTLATATASQPSSGFFGTIGQWTNYFTPSLGLSSSSSSDLAASSDQQLPETSRITYNAPQTSNKQDFSSSNAWYPPSSSDSSLSSGQQVPETPWTTYNAPPQQTINNQGISNSYPWYAPALPPLPPLPPLPSLSSSSVSAADKSQPHYPAAEENFSSNAEDKGELYPPVSSDGSQSASYPEYPSYTQSGNADSNVAYQQVYGVLPNSETIPIPPTPQFEMSQETAGLRLPKLPDLPEVHIPKEFLMTPANTDDNASDSNLNRGTYIRVRYPNSDFNPVPEMPTFLPAQEFNQFRNTDSESDTSSSGFDQQQQQQQPRQNQQQQFVYDENAPAETLPNLGQFPLANYNIYSTDENLKNSYGTAAIPYLFPNDQALELVSDDNANIAAASSQYHSDRVLPDDVQIDNIHSSQDQVYDIINTDNEGEIHRRSDKGPQRITAYDTFATGKINRANSDAVRHMIPTQMPFDHDDGRSIIDAIATKTSDGLVENDQ